MLKLNTFLGLLALCTFSLVGCATTGTTGTTAAPAVAEAASSCDACTKGKAGETVWCTHCNTGYHAGEKVACESCYKAETDGTACTSCPASADEVTAKEDTTTANADTTKTDTN